MTLEKPKYEPLGSGVTMDKIKDRIEKKDDKWIVTGDIVATYDVLAWGDSDMFATEKTPVRVMYGIILPIIEGVDYEEDDIWSQTEEDRHDMEMKNDMTIISILSEEVQESLKDEDSEDKHKQTIGHFEVEIEESDDGYESSYVEDSIEMFPAVSHDDYDRGRNLEPIELGD